MKKTDDDKMNPAQNGPAGQKAPDEKAQNAAQPEKAAENPQADSGRPAETPDDGSREPAAEEPANEKNEGKKGKGKKDEKKVSETEVLKIYLQQAMAEIKRLQGDGETARREKETLDASLHSVKEQYGSLKKEYENYRRRTAEEKAALHDDAVAEVVAALLPALDSLERAMDFSGSNAESFQKGVEMTLRQLSDGFKKLGVEEIEAQSQPFNPDVHNAVMHVEDKNLGESVVADVFQKGYRIGDRVIRHSMVKVAN